MTRNQVVRMFGVSATLVVIALVGGAMLHKDYAPPISADQARPHTERGPCSNCHKILPPARPVAATTGLGQAATPTQEQLVPTDRMQPNNLPVQKGTDPTTVAWPGAAPTLPVAYWAQAQAALPAPASAPVPFVAAVPGRPTRIAPAIVAGTPPPHAWRGQCAHCHLIIQPQNPAPSPAPAAPESTAAWQPTPPLPWPNTTPSPPPQAPQEAEALGMSVRPTRGGVQGLMVVEVEGLARRAGLQLGDVVRAMDGQVTTDVTSFLAASRTADPARGVVVDTVRDGLAQVVILR